MFIEFIFFSVTFVSISRLSSKQGDVPFKGDTWGDSLVTLTKSLLDKGSGSKGDKGDVFIEFIFFSVTFVSISRLSSKL